MCPIFIDVLLVSMAKWMREMGVLGREEGYGGEEGGGDL